MNSPVIDKAKSLGFISIGFSRPQIPLYYDEFLVWLSEGNNAEMKWLERNLEIRKNPVKLLDNCKTIITLAYPYSKEKHLTSDGYSLSRYSEPLKEDYHHRLKRLCRELVELIKMQYRGKSRICVDSAPILEKSFACVSGIGFIGKNNMFIVPGYGSYLYLVEILTTVRFETHQLKQIANQCGSCNLCIEACPTGALKDPYILDASRCLSYLTIEDRGQVDDLSAGKMGDCFLGCDRCQEVCPFNEPPRAPKISLPSTDEILKMSADKFNEVYGKTAFERAGFEKIKANINAIRGLGI